MIDIKLQLALTLAQSNENLSEFLMNLQEEQNLVEQETWNDCTGCQDCSEPDSTQDIPSEILDAMNASIEEELREQGQEDRLTKLEKMFGMDQINVSDRVKGMTNEEATISGIQDGLQAALQKIFGPSAKISSIRL